MPFLPGLGHLKHWIARHDDFGGSVYVLGRAFGLKLDGTNERAKAQDAIDYLEGIGGGSLLLAPDPARPLTLDGPLILPRTGTVDIRGTGRHSRIVNTAGAGVDTLRFGDDAINVVSRAEYSKFKMECPNGANGFNLNNSRDVSSQTGTVSVTEGSRLVNGTGTNFTANFDYTRDSILITGADDVEREFEIRTKGVRAAGLIELARSYPYPDVVAKPHRRARYGNGSRLVNLTDLWFEGPDTATAGSIAINNERVNNNRYVNIWIRGFARAFVTRAVNGRSAGCYMETVMANRATEVSYDFEDTRSFAMKRVRAEGAGAVIADYKYRFVLCVAFEFDQVTGEDDHGVAGFLFEDCERMRGTVAVGTNFGGGVGVDVVNSGLMDLSGQIATQALRAEDWPTTPDVYSAPIRVDATSRAGEGEFDINAENLPYIENDSSTFALRVNDWDNTQFRVFRDPRAQAHLQDTFTGAVSLNYLHANHTLYADISGGSYDVTLFNSSPENAGLRILLVVRSDTATTNICTLRCAGTDVMETGNTSAAMTVATNTALRRGDVIEVECTGNTGATADLVAWRIVRRHTRRTLGVSTGVATVRMPDGTAATNTGWIVHPGNVMSPTWPAQ
jgi:hypothetical protein